MPFHGKEKVLKYKIEYFELFLHMLLRFEIGRMRIGQVIRLLNGVNILKHPVSLK